MLVSDLMTRDVFTLTPDLTLRLAVEELGEHGVHGAPVVTDGAVVGVCSTSDILDFQASEPGVPTSRPDLMEWGEAVVQTPVDDEEEAEPASPYFVDYWEDAGADVFERFSEPGPEWDVLEEHVVGDVMTRRVYALGPGADLADAARFMVDAGAHRLLVLDGAHLVGILSAWDVLKAVADRRI
ncbi:MAG: CBS domain-containing protein [Gemmatimonadota bacterium]